MSLDEERPKGQCFDLSPSGRAIWPIPRPQKNSDSPEPPETLSNEGSDSTTDADKLDDPSGSEGDHSSSCDMEEESELPSLFCGACVVQPYSLVLRCRIRHCVIL